MRLAAVLAGLALALPGMASAVAVILFGVRTILAELVPAFQGIANKVVPGAFPALDAPIVFPYAQNAVLIGFISSFVGGLIEQRESAVALSRHDQEIAGEELNGRIVGRHAARGVGPRERLGRGIGMPGGAHDEHRDGR